MNDQLLADLAAFERADLRRDEIVARHGAVAGMVVSLHARLRTLAEAPPFDVDAGWALVANRIAEPAPVVRLHPRGSRRRFVALTMAAALMLGGSAMAMIGANEDTFRPSNLPTLAPAPTLVGSDATPHGVRTAAGPGFAAGGSEATGTGDGTPPDAGSTSPTPSGTGSSDGTGSGSGTGSGATDDPNDSDNGTGNDGQHDDNGKGNDGPVGSPRGGGAPSTSHG